MASKRWMVRVAQWGGTLLLLGGGFANIAFAQSTITITNTSGAQGILCNILNVMFDALMMISVIMVLYAAFEYITANGDSEKITTARRIILYAACGIIAALVAKGFPSLVASLFGQNSSACESVSSSISY